MSVCEACLIRVIVVFICLPRWHVLLVHFFFTMINKTTITRTTVLNDTVDITLPRIIILFNGGADEDIVTVVFNLKVEICKVLFVFSQKVLVKRGVLCTKIVVSSCCVVVGEINWEYWIGEFLPEHVIAAF